MRATLIQKRTKVRSVEATKPTVTPVQAKEQADNQINKAKMPLRTVVDWYLLLNAVTAMNKKRRKR